MNNTQLTVSQLLIATLAHELDRQQQGLHLVVERNCTNLTISGWTQSQVWAYALGVQAMLEGNNIFVNQELTVELVGINKFRLIAHSK